MNFPVKCGGRIAVYTSCWWTTAKVSNSFMSEYLSEMNTYTGCLQWSRGIEDIRKKQRQYCNKRHHDASDEWNRAMSANQNKHAMVPHSRYIAYSPYGRRIQK